MPRDRVVVVCDDLFFWSRIRSIADDRVEVVRVTTEAEAVRELAAGGVARVLVELGGGDPGRIDWVARVAAADDAPEIVGFFAHLRDDIGRRAKEAGFDRVLAKSRFVAELGRWVAPRP